MNRIFNNKSLPFIIIGVIILILLFCKKSKKKSEKFSKIKKLRDNKKILIYNFNTKWCSYSVQFQPIWNEFSKLISKKYPNVEAIDVKCDEDNNKKLCQKYNVQGYPYILIVKDGKKIEYNNDRTVQKLEEKIESLIKKN